MLQEGIFYKISNGKPTLIRDSRELPNEIPEGHVHIRSLAFKTDPSDDKQLAKSSSTVSMQKNLYDGEMIIPGGHENIVVIENWNNVPFLDNHIKGKTIAIINPTLSDGSCDNCLHQREDICLQPENFGLGNPSAGSATTNSYVRVNPKNPEHTLWIPQKELFESIDSKEKSEKLFRALVYTESATVGVWAAQKAIEHGRSLGFDPLKKQYVVSGATGAQASNIIATLLASQIPPKNIHLTARRENELEAIVSSYAKIYGDKMQFYVLPREDPDGSLKKLVFENIKANSGGIDAVIETVGYGLGDFQTVLKRGGYIVSVGLIKEGEVSIPINAFTRSAIDVNFHYGRKATAIYDFYFKKIIPDMMKYDDHPLWEKAGSFKNLDDTIITNSETDNLEWLKDKSPTFLHEGINPHEVIKDTKSAYDL